jgi:CheY-like chemotaxis protein
VVEEAQRVLQRVREAFRACDLPVSMNYACTIEDARRFVAKLPPDLLMTSLRVADGNGLELVPEPGAAIRFPVVVLVEHTARPGGAEAVKAGASEYVLKSDDELAGLGRVAERTLREWQHIEEKNRLLETMEIIPDFVGTAGKDGRMLYVNGGGRRMLGLRDDDDISAKRLHELFPDWSIDSLIGSEITSAVPEVSWSPTTRLLHQEGQEIRGAVLAHLSPAGEVGYYTIFARRTRERQSDGTRPGDRQLSLRLETIGKLAAGIAHDLNNALAPIISQGEMALADTEETSDIYHRLTEILRASNRARDLARQIVSFGSRTGVDRRPLTAETIVCEALNVARAAIPSSIEIDQKLHTDCGTIIADTAEIYQVVVSLCLRAFDTMRTSGRGVINARLDRFLAVANGAKCQPGLREGPYARLTITDTGTNDTPAIDESALQPIPATKETRSDRALAEAHRIVVAHGGEMLVHTYPGSGTTVRVYLPIVEDNGDGLETDDHTATGHKRILFVDDEDAIARAVEQLLRRHGYQVTCRRNGLDALAQFCTHPDRYDLVITDQTMPQMGGEQLAKRLRRVRPDIPIILTTGYNYGVTSATMRALGIRGFLHKPFGAHELSEAIRKALHDG